MKLGTLADRDHDIPAEWSSIEVSGLTADSREVKPGYLFAALPGTAVDGAAYVGQALESGAAAILASSVASIPESQVPVIRDDNPRRALARFAARFYAPQPHTIVAVTGTNGKTSVAAFVRQIWQKLGFSAASIGTIGVVAPTTMRTLLHTTPDPVTLHQVFRDLSSAGVTHVALETSSHGLAQYRVDGVTLAAAAFTNISRDHLDYHADFEDYFMQKLRLFEELLPGDAAAVVFADTAEAGRVVATARRRGHTILTVGRKGETIRLADWRRDGLGQRLTVVTDGQAKSLLLPLVGDFQTANALVAAGLAVATGGGMAAVLEALESLEGAPGRLELVDRKNHGAAIFVDYAHTPDALANALDALRPYAERRLVVVFGCGGDRDRGKRPQMGAIAAAKADVVLVTDDNPRTEDPAAIRAAILQASPGAIDVGDRAEAIGRAIGILEAGDVLLVAGKGHEAGQIVGNRIIPFSDKQVVRDFLGESRRHG